MKRNRVLAAVAAVVLLVLVFTTLLLLRKRVERHRLLRPGAEVTTAPREVPPVAEWTATFERLPGEELAGLLAQIEREHSDLYEKWSLGYAHARALITSDATRALDKLEPFIRQGHPFRNRALYHRASLASGEEASGYRRALIVEHPDSPYLEEAIDEEIEYLATEGDPARLVEFAAKILPAASTERRREISARTIETLVAANQIDSALTQGLAILQASIADDAADRVVRSLYKPEIIQRLTTRQLALFGEAFQRHRHFDEAVSTLQRAVQQGYTDDLQFALGRSWFGNEKYEEAQAAYLRGAAVTKEAQWKATFFWHAARAAQLRNDDRTAEALMTQTIAVKGNFPATKAALTQRLRTRLRQRRLPEAASDLALLRRIAGNERSYLDGALAYAVGLVAAGNSQGAIDALNSVPRRLIDPYDAAEFAYWRARALETRDLAAALQAYLEVLRSSAPSHFAYFARDRLDSPELAGKLERELALREQQVATLIEEKKLDLARRVQTDRILLSSKDREAQLQKLATIYRELPEYRRVLEMKPAALPRFPDADVSDPDTLLMAMGLHDEAIAAIGQRWPIRPPEAALTRSHALNLAGASRDSIYAIEVMMRSVPDDYHPDLLPIEVRRLLYPRYFYDFIVSDAKRYDADPRLVLSIMREESRFNPRAKSQAAARGLLQFIITTARDIGRAVGLVDVTPQDLYDPRIIIQLGAKYVSELSNEFDGDSYRVAGAYNAGPKQVALWSRVQAAPGRDYFLTAVNFDETKHYIRKVMNSYERYGQVYGEEETVGGLQVQP